MEPQRPAALPNDTGASPEAPKTIGTHRLLFNPPSVGLPDRFPFPQVFSFEPLIARWRDMAETDPDTYAQPFADLERRLADTPELTRPITDPDVFVRHADTVAILVRPIFPDDRWQPEMRGLIAAFGDHFLYTTARFNSVMLASDEQHRQGQVNITSTLYSRMLYAYRAILRKYYDFDMKLDQPVILVVPDEHHQLNRYLKLNGASHFIQIHARGEVPELSPADLDELIHHLDDIGLWMKRLPPERFEFSGFSVVSMVDVTNEVATASLTHILLTNEGGTTEDSFDLLELELRSLFRSPHLRLGLASLQGDGALNLRSDRKIWNSLRIRDALRSGRLDLRGTFYEQVLREGRLVAVQDLADLPPENPVRAPLLEQNVRSILLAPLHYDGRLVGLLELSSPQPGDLQALAALKLKQIESIFALAIHQNLEQFENRVATITQDTYTAIHPTVAWRFREAAIAMLERRKAEGVSRPEPIVFKNLHALYGSADIRGSSNRRNEAIRADLTEHLERAHETLDAAFEALPLTIIEEVSHRVEARIHQLSQGWSTGDESDVADFIHIEINPLLRHFREAYRDLAPNIDAYFAHTAEEGDLISHRREAYESSLSRINDAILAILQAEQFELQQIFPHYFEHFKTDGIEYSMYLGASLTPRRTFDPVYVRNLRLRQLRMCCAIARRVDRLKPEMSVPLDVAQLVLVQHTPLTIRFRHEEKKFDVDGAYSIRYEILKKRIDKARVRGTQERVTQPDHVAIIYTLDKEAAEYTRYIDFLKARGELLGDVERLDLEDLPGVSGLRAMRVAVNLEAPPTRQENTEFLEMAREIAFV